MVVIWKSRYRSRKVWIFHTIVRYKYFNPVSINNLLSFIKAMYAVYRVSNRDMKKCRESYFAVKPTVLYILSVNPLQCFLLCLTQQKNVSHRSRWGKKKRRQLLQTLSRCRTGAIAGREDRSCQELTHNLP